ncbi:MAG: hypothetical protein LBS50_02765 [Prevotellaceae bacterium]|jgi:hypothetical protein|nr:hypothetical protein [Prevotellaceae bacterium]
MKKAIIISLLIILGILVTPKVILWTALNFCPFKEAGIHTVNSVDLSKKVDNIENFARDYTIDKLDYVFAPLLSPKKTVERGYGDCAEYHYYQKYDIPKEAKSVSLDYGFSPHQTYRYKISHLDSWTTARFAITNLEPFFNYFAKFI